MQVAQRFSPIELEFVPLIKDSGPPAANSYDSQIGARTL